MHGSKHSSHARSPKWRSIKLDYTQFLDPSLVRQINAKLLPQGCKLHGMFIEVTQAFAGTGITGCTVSMGSSASPTELSTAFEVTQTVSQQDSEKTKVAWGADFQIISEAKSTGANLDQLTSGELLIHLLISKIA